MSVDVGCNERAKPGRGRRAAALLGLASTLLLTSGLPVGAAEIETDAAEILRSMTKYLGGLPSFRVAVDVDNEVLDQQGQKVHLTSSSQLVVQRPDKLYGVRRSGAGQAEIVFDGKVITIHGMLQNLYMQIESPGDLNQALQNASIETGIDFPAADLLYSDAYDSLMSGAVSGAYLGSGYVGGIECHHLAFRSAQVDWQIWIQTGDAPLPMKYVIITKWTTAAPQYSAQFSNWDTKPKIDPKRFDFSPPKNATKLDALPIGPTGDFVVEVE